MVSRSIDLSGQSLLMADFSPFSFWFCGLPFFCFWRALAVQLVFCFAVAASVCIFCCVSLVLLVPSSLACYLIKILRLKKKLSTLYHRLQQLCWQQSEMISS
jgi:hypothetical protein